MVILLLTPSLFPLASLRDEVVLEGVMPSAYVTVSVVNRSDALLPFKLANPLNRQHRQGQ